MAQSTTDRELIAAVSRQVVATVAPEEIALFPAVSTAFFDKPAKLSQAPRDDMLGFGGGEVVTLLTPVALSVVGEVLLYLRHELARTMAQETAGGLEAGLRSLFHKLHGASSSAPVAHLTQQQVAQVRELAFARARATGLSEARSGLLADAVAGSLALAP